jgi:hypothetical protein
VIFTGQCIIIEENNPKQFFEAPENACTQKFLKQVFVHSSGLESLALWLFGHQTKAR